MDFGRYNLFKISCLNYEAKVLYVLSYGFLGDVAKRIREGYRFDQELVDFLQRKGLPYIDTMEAHVTDYIKYNPNVDESKMTIEEYLKRYYVGHYNPLGNFFQAFAIKDKLVEMLEPKPIPYRQTIMKESVTELW